VAGKSFSPPQRDQTHPLGPKARAVVQTTIEVREALTGSGSILDVTTADRPGLLVDIVSVLKVRERVCVKIRLFFVRLQGSCVRPPLPMRTPPTLPPLPLCYSRHHRNDTPPGHQRQRGVG
jgi:hypothetical protein